MKKIVIATFFLIIGLYILLPTPDDIVIDTTGAILLYKFYEIHPLQGYIITFFVYRGLGVICAIFALLLGGKTIYKKLRERNKNIYKRSSLKKRKEGP